MNIYDWLILAAIIAAAGLALRKIIRNRGNNCGCGCENCQKNCNSRKRI